jgi:hypothetical protein
MSETEIIKTLKQYRTTLSALRNACENQLVEVDNQLKRFASSNPGTRRNLKRERAMQFSDKGWTKPIK